MRNKKLNIVIHQPRISYYLGGGEIVPLEQARFLSELGHKITILTRKTDQESPVFKKFKENNGRNLKIVTLKLTPKFEKFLAEEPGKSWKRWELEALYFGQIAQSFYKKNLKKIDLIATHLTTDSLLLPKNIKNVLHLHGEPSRITNTMRLELMRPDGFVNVSKNIFAFWKKYTQNRPNKTIYNGIDTLRFRPGKTERNVDILYVGRFIKNKGIFNILEAINDYKDKKIILIGSGPLKKQILTYCKDKKNVKILSNISESDLIRYYQKSKIFACPSTSREGVLTTMLEAAASGCAIVTTNCCGMKDFAKNNRNAIFVRPNNSKELKAAFARLISDTKLQLKLARRAHKDIKKNWTWRRQIKKLERFYLQICKK